MELMMFSSGMSFLCTGTSTSFGSYWASTCYVRFWHGQHSVYRLGYLATIDATIDLLHKKRKKAIKVAGAVINA